MTARDHRVTDVLIEDVVWQAAAAHFGAGLPKGRDLAAAIIERSERYTSRRDELGGPQSGRAGSRDLAARALFFALADMGKVRIPLGELAAVGALPSTPSWRVCDLGAGTGAMSYALCALAGARGHRVERVAIDCDREALTIGDRVMALLGPALPVALSSRSLVDDLARPAPVFAHTGPFDLIVAGTVFNELADAGHRLEVVKAAMASVAPGGAMIIIEPALRESSRALHELRDAILTGDIAKVFAPCTHGLAPCPMLRTDRDWCHEDRAEVLPPRTRELTRQTALRTHGLKFSYLVLTHEPRSIAERGGSPPPPGALYRVVSHQAKEKGKMSVMVCGESGHGSMRLLRRNRSATNRAFDGLDRGDLLTTTGGLELGASDQVERWRLGRDQNDE